MQGLVASNTAVTWDSRKLDVWAHDRLGRVNEYLYQPTVRLTSSGRPQCARLRLVTPGIERIDQN
jgi:hypothetical protein